MNSFWWDIIFSYGTCIRKSDLLVYTLDLMVGHKLGDIISLLFIAFEKKKIPLTRVSCGFLIHIRFVTSQNLSL